MKAYAISCLLAALAWSAGCGSQTDADYTGDAQGVLRGKLTLEDGIKNPGDIEVALLWHNTRGSPDISYGQRVSVKGNFPAGFELELVEPPPTEYLNDYSGNGTFDEPRLGLAYIVAAPKGFDFASELPDDTIIGASKDYMIAYLDDDAEPGSHVAFVAGAPLEKGFHLLHSTPSTVTDAEVAAWETRCDTGSACDLELERFFDLASSENGSEREKERARKEWALCERAAARALGEDCVYTHQKFDILAPAPDGFDTEVEIVLRVGDAETPGWT
jgi:hypothetical protein